MARDEKGSIRRDRILGSNIPGGWGMGDRALSRMSGACPYGACLTHSLPVSILMLDTTSKCRSSSASRIVLA